MAAANIRCRGGDSRAEEAEQLPRLLAMRDSSWQPCSVKIGSSGLEVVFEEDETKMIIPTKDEAIRLIRIRSVPLQGAECNLIRQGDRVLATPKPLCREVFLEAVVEERTNAKHSKKRCTCSFVVRWINGHVPGGETTALPLSAIMTMPDSRIDIHPAIEAFFSNVSRGVQAVSGAGKNRSIVRKLFESGEASEEDASSPESNASEDAVVAAPLTILHRTKGDANRSRSNGERVKRKLFSLEEKQSPSKSARLLGPLPRTRSQHKK